MKPLRISAVLLLLLAVTTALTAASSTENDNASVGEGRSKGDGADTAPVRSTEVEEGRSKRGKKKKGGEKGGSHYEFFYHEPPTHHHGGGGGGGYQHVYAVDGDMLSMGAGVTFIIAAMALICYMAYLSFGSGGGGHDYDYGHKYRSLDDSDSYFNLKILDWIAMMEEIYRKFDLKRMDCQKRLVCELHQNQDELGPTARKMARAMSYLEYLDGVSMPDPIRQLVTEYNDAARKGRSMQKDCGEMYTTCQFSVKELFRKYNKQTNNHLRK